jgi:RNA polymerase sigma-70 factor (ECF subfamily)
LTEKELVLRAQRGDQEAFRALYEDHGPRLLALLRHMTGDLQRAEEALADAFVRAHRALARFDPERPFGPWIREVARNAARDLRRGPAAEPAPERASREPDAVEALAETERLEAVLGTLVDLPERERRVLNLRYRKGLTLHDTATEIGCSRRTVATLQKNALARLTGLLRGRLGKSGEKERGPWTA